MLQPNDLYLFVVVIAQQLVLIGIDDSIIPSPSRKRAPSRKPLPAPEARRNTPPQTRRQQRNSRQDGNESTDRSNGVDNPLAVLIEGAHANTAAFTEPNASKLAVPIAPDPVARRGGDADGDDDGEEQAHAAETASFLFELFFLAGTRARSRVLEFAPAGTRVQWYFAVSGWLPVFDGVGVFEAEL